MELLRRPYQEGDYWRIREFLRETLVLHDFRERNWPLYRWDYCRWHVWENIVQPSLEEAVFLWETPDGRLAAVLNIEERGQVFLQIHPDLRTATLEEEMLAVAEIRFAIPTPEGPRSLDVWTNQLDSQRHALLRQRGYKEPTFGECQRRQLLDRPIEPTPVPPGYVVRALGDRDELPRRSWASWRAFHPNEPDDHYEGWEWYLNVQRAPLYRRDLDLVAVAANGDIASFCTIWFDDVTRTGAFEPVGTAPEHQRRGLGKAVMTEGLSRLQWYGATIAYVASTGPGGHALYASVGFTDYEQHAPWRKMIQP
jgi:mycothiol synthase